jgi:glycosyltransferase involved in cell wall biosynthesis
MREQLTARGLEPSKVVVFRPGVDPSGREPAVDRPETAPSSTGSVFILTVANWQRIKGLEFLLDVLEGLSNLPWAWHLAGNEHADEKYSTRLQRRISLSPVKKRIHRHGVQAPALLRNLFRRADLFALASDMESYGIVFAESLAEGLPVVGNRVGGVPEIIKHGVTGYLCRRSNTRDWRRLLGRLISSKEERDRMGHNALRESKHLLSWEDSARLLHRLCSGRLDSFEV